MMPPVLKSKTIWFAILLAVLPVLQNSVSEFTLTPLQQLLVMQAIAATVAVLRFLTTEPLANK